MNFPIGSTIIDRNSKPYLIAEIGLNHNNDLTIGKKTIQAAKACGANAVKFQTYKTEDFISQSQADAKFLFDIFKQYELSKEFHLEFQKIAKNEGLDFFSTPLDLHSVDLLLELGVPIFKIASGDIVNLPLLNKVIQTKLPMLVSTGAALPEEVERAIRYLEESKQSFAILHCVSLYPTPIHKANLNSIPYYLDRTNVVVGFSDHSNGSLAASIAVGLGANIIEKHFTLDTSLEGPDHTISADPNQMLELRQKIDEAFSARGEYGKNVHQEEISGWYYGRRSLYKQGKEILAMRPALHVRDKKYLEAWRANEVNDPSSYEKEGPLFFETKVD
ncbi:N-acetyl neuraminic (sialic) acid synthetase [Leptospira ryugenii]|uniref:N-acetyl neuraminic (Sialic) acid synthetase n=1 Tax=Leptospira ryugenii TaxID=1917863 RepID=A0A2P2DZ93_9LEPT|nr:N-acetylneuraminate synthase family protein [Leptospira ryugenii]GBF49940.1 N-acetyl neuraminic (sialic) acid synthetase [Leptospira ryugenii]